MAASLFAVGCGVVSEAAGETHATLVIRNETDATLTISIFRYGLVTKLDKVVPPRKVISFFNQLPQGVDIDVEAEPRCVQGVGGVAKSLVVTGTGRYELTFHTRDFGKTMLLDGPSCGGGGSAVPQGECYAENRNIDLVGTRGRALDGAMIANDDAMTVEKCVKHCADGHFAYAGLQFGKWCFCGNAPGTKVAQSTCAMPCSGNPAQMCGGPWANSVYSVRHFPGIGSEAPGPASPTPDRETCPDGYNAYGCGRR